MAFQYPPKDTWVDRMEVSYVDAYGTEVVATYILEKNLWVHRVVVAGSNAIGVNIYTDDVLTVPEKVEEIRETLRKKLRSFDIYRDEDLARLDNQAEVNVQLVDYLRKLGDSHLWVGDTEPPKDEDGDYLFTFWWKPTEEELYIYIDGEWVLSGLMEFDRPPIIQASPPTSHPKFPGKPLEEGDFWIDSLDEIYYWKYTNEDGSEGEWVQTRDADTNSDRPPIISDTEPTEHPKFPGEPLEEGDFWIDNHDKRAATTIYYWTGSEWELIDDHENWDEQLKEHTCVQFYTNVGFQKYEQVRNQEGHYLAYSLLTNNTTQKFWLSPTHPGFYVSGEYYYVNDAGPYLANDVTEADQWTTILLEGCPNPAAGTVKVSKIPKLCDTSYNDGRYVLKAGDTMTGALVMDNAGEIEMQNTELDFMAVGESLKDGDGDPILEDDGQGNMVEQWDPANERFSNIESVSPRLVRSDGSFGADAKTPFGIRVELDDGNTYKNQLRIGNRHGEAITVYGGGGPQVIFGDFARNDTSAHGIDNGVLIKNIPTPDRELTPGDFAVNKEYVDKEDLALLNGLIDLQEEIDAIAPSLEKGAWEWDPNLNVSRPPDPGKYYLLRGVFPTWQITDEYTLADAAVFHIRDMNGTNHENWDTILGDPNDPDDDKLILLFDKPDPDKCLGKIHNIYDIGETNNPFGTAAIVEFHRIEAEGKPSNRQDDDGKYITYVNIFQEPSGGDASEFVLKKGDEMTGELNLRTEKTDGTINFSSPPLKSHHLRFSTTRTDTDATRHSYIYQPGYSTDLIVSNVFRAKGSIHSGTGYYFAGKAESDGTWTSYRPRVYFEETFGGFYYNGTSTSNRRYYFNSSGAFIYGSGSSYSAKFNSAGGELNYNGTAVAYWGSGYFAIPKGLQAPISSNSGTIGYGTSGQVLKTNGSTVYWGSAGTSGTFVKRAGSQSVTIQYSNGNFLISQA